MRISDWSSDVCSSDLLFNVISGYAKPSSGTIELRGRSIGGQAPAVIASEGVRRTFQNGGVFTGMTVFENVLTGLHSKTHSSMLGLALNLPGARKAEAEENGRTSGRKEGDQDRE